jgi:hypothetical protein
MGATTAIAKKNKEILKLHSDEIIEYYKNNPNVNDVVSTFGLSRVAVVKLLKQVEAYKGFGRQPSRSIKRMNTLQQRYGVTNYGQTPMMRQRLMERNSIPYNQPLFLADLYSFRKNVDTITARNKKLLLNTGYCFYTGIRFGDVIRPTNPNDPIKKTIDHKISIVDGYLRKYTAEEIGGLSNLCWAIKYCNSFKGNMSANDFIYYSRLIRERFIDAGYEHN